MSETTTAPPDCLFCKVAAGRIPAEIVYQDDETVAFRDINLQAPTHVLVIPRRHVPNATEAADANVWEAVMGAAARVARQEGVHDRGYRLVVNCGPEAGQTVDHLHVHVLGGRPLTWPPG
ncbi:MAG: histidine triad nucleotide-binding protein [Chloroflexota bacterium]|nr:histidine triad nucleotide-binding protein [Chloroflexota bacterium]